MRCPSWRLTADLCTYLSTMTSRSHVSQKRPAHTDTYSTYYTDDVTCLVIYLNHFRIIELTEKSKHFYTTVDILINWDIDMASDNV